MEQQLTLFTNKKIDFSFNPHLLPTFRGILTAIYVTTKKGKSGKILRNSLKNFTKNQNL